MFALRSVRVTLATMTLLGSSIFGVAGAAHAASQSLTVPIVGPNTRICMQPVLAVAQVEAWGTASNNPMPRATYTLNRSTDGGTTYTQIFSVTAPSAHVILSTTFGNFPGLGLYKWCGRNVTTSGETLSLSVDSY